MDSIGRTRLTKGDHVWYSHSDDGFRPGRVDIVHRKQQEYSIRDEEDRDVIVTIPFEQNNQEHVAIQKRDDSNIMATDDMSSMPELTDASILYNLRSRFLKERIYTNIGPILVAVNPYKNIHATLNEKAPGILKTVNKIYEEMINNKESHSCVVTGESGAGKTESVRMFVNHLVTLSARRSTLEGSMADVAQSHSLQERIIQVSPILEAFGNAKTVKNDNSSRFGKWVEVEIDFSTGQPLSANIRNYLLEKSRIVKLGPGERNFHIFYQVLTDEELCKRLNIDPHQQYRLLEKSKGVSCKVDDSEDFALFKTALEVIGLRNEEQDFIFRCICALLVLGNVRFDSQLGDQDSCVIQSACRNSISHASSLLGLEESDLEKCLITRTIEMDRDRILKPNSVADAEASLNVLIKTVYHSLFEWVTERINCSLDRIADDIENANDELKDSGYNRMIESGTIGILDAFGFEIFKTNSFEQLCINYCNEKMQLHFNRLVFEQEIQEYLREGILTCEEQSHFTSAGKSLGHKHDTNIADCVKLLEGGRGHGIFALIDDELKLPNGSDAGLLRKLRVLHKDHPNFVVPKVKGRESTAETLTLFRIKHYAGSVTYNVDGFLEKSSDLLPKEMQLLFTKSRDKYFQEAFPAQEEVLERIKGGKTKKTLGTQFKEQLGYLSNIIFEDSVPHFIRCIKPNDEAKPMKWVGSRVLEQIRYAGLLEASRVRASGFPVRYDFENFKQIFSHLAPGYGRTGHGKTVSEGYIKMICLELEQAKILHNGLYRVGKTKVFLREEQRQLLEGKRHTSLLEAAAQIQALYRSCIVRRRVKAALSAKKRVEQVRKGSNRFELVKRKVEFTRAIEWNSVIKQSSMRYLAQIESEIATLDRLSTLEDELAISLKQWDWDGIDTLLTKAPSLGYSGPLLDRARAAKRQQETVETVMADLERNLHAISEKPHFDTTQDRRRLRKIVGSVRKLISSLSHGQTALERICPPPTNEQKMNLMEVIKSAKQLCRAVEDTYSAIAIQNLFILVKARRRARILRRRIFVTLELLKIAIDFREEKDIEQHLKTLDRVGLGMQSKQPHYLVRDAIAVRANLRLARLGAANQLDRLTKKLSRRIRHREKQLAAEQKDEENVAFDIENVGKGTLTPNAKPREQDTKAKKQKRKLSIGFGIFRNVFHVGGSKKPHLRKSELDLLLQAIEKAREHGVPECHDTMKEALLLVSRLENLKQLKRGTALRMFSSNSLMSAASGFTGSQKSGFASVSWENVRLDTEYFPLDDVVQECDDSEIRDFQCTEEEEVEWKSEDAERRTPNNVAPSPEKLGEEELFTDGEYNGDDDSVDCMLFEESKKDKSAKSPDRNLKARGSESLRKVMSVSKLLPRRSSKSFLNSKNETSPSLYEGSPPETLRDDRSKAIALEGTARAEEDNGSCKDIYKLVETYGRAPPPPPDILGIGEYEVFDEEVPGLPTSVQRVMLERITRDREMRKVIESRYWQNRRGSKLALLRQIY